MSQPRFIGFDLASGPDRAVIETPWLRLEREEIPGAKTCKWLVSSREGGALLGVVGWYAPWRRYVFAPHAKTIYEEQCLHDLAEILEHLTQQQRATWKRRASP